MLLYLVRHGEKERSKNQIGKPIAQHGLSKSGLEQAKRAGIFFKSKKIDVVYCSELERAKQTLNKILPYLNKSKVIYTKDINERSWGIHKTREEFEQALQKSEIKDYKFKPVGGEDYFDVEKRAQNFLNFLVKNHEEHNVLLVGHGIFFRFLILRMFKLHMNEITNFELSHGGISTFKIEKSKIVDFHLDESNHLLEHSSYERESFDEGTPKF